MTGVRRSGIFVLLTTVGLQFMRKQEIKKYFLRIFFIAAASSRVISRPVAGRIWSAAAIRIPLF